MKILIIGGSRGIGKALLECALDDGHEVTVLARYPEKITMGSSRLQVVPGDILDKESLRPALADQEAVCSCIGAPITFKPVELFSRGAANLVDVLKDNPPVKLVAVTGIGAGDTKGHGGFLYDFLFKPLFLKTIYEDKDREEEIIMNSGLDWLIVRPAGLTNGRRTGEYRVITELQGVSARRISRRDVADFILRELVTPTCFGTAPLITY